jgi:hypothetical protein
MRWLPWAGPCLLLGAALFDLPYGYYRLLRVAIFLVALFHVWGSIERSDRRWAWIFGAVALVYNPIAALPLGRPLWTVVNIATVLILLAHWRYTCLPQSTGKAPTKRNII